jgi:hypothetical protein
MPIPIHKVKPAVLRAAPSVVRAENVPVVVDLNLSDHRLLKVAPPVLNRVFNHPLLTPFHVNPLHARFATLPTLNNTPPLMMSIFSQ